MFEYISSCVNCVGYLGGIKYLFLRLGAPEMMIGSCFRFLCSRFEGRTEVPMETLPDSQEAGPSSSVDAMSHQENMVMVPEVGYGLSDLVPPVSHESASQAPEPTGSHPDFAGGIMRIAPAEVNVSFLSCIWMLHLRQSDTNFLQPISSRSLLPS